MYSPTAKTTVVNANRITSRVVNRISNVSLNTTGPNGGTRGYATVLNPLSAFAGSDSLTSQYDQFRIRNISVYARPDTANASNFTAGQFNALYSAVNTTTISSYIDYDTFASPTEATFLGRDSMKIRSLPGGKFTLVANYSPRVRMSDAVNNLPALVPPTTSWISTEFADLDWLGLALRTTCDGAAWGVDANNCLRIQLFIKATVDFRGMSKPADSVSLPQINDPTILQSVPVSRTTEQHIPIDKSEPWPIKTVFPDKHQTDLDDPADELDHLAGTRSALPRDKRFVAQTEDSIVLTMDSLTLSHHEKE